MAPSNNQAYFFTLPIDPLCRAPFKKRDGKQKKNKTKVKKSTGRKTSFFDTTTIVALNLSHGFPPQGIELSRKK